MSLVDRTNETIQLMIPADVLTVDVDQDMSIWPEPWVYIESEVNEEHPIHLTLAEAEKLYDRLGRILGKMPTLGLWPSTIHPVTGRPMYESCWVCDTGGHDCSGCGEPVSHDGYESGGTLHSTRRCWE